MQSLQEIKNLVERIKQDKYPGWEDDLAQWLPYLQQLGKTDNDAFELYQEASRMLDDAEYQPKQEQPKQEDQLITPLPLNPDTNVPPVEDESHTAWEKPTNPDLTAELNRLSERVRTKIDMWYNDQKSALMEKYKKKVWYELFAKYGPTAQIVNLVRLNYWKGALQRKYGVLVDAVCEQFLNKSDLTELTQAEDDLINQLDTELDRAGFNLGEFQDTFDMWAPYINLTQLVNQKIYWYLISNVADTITELLNLTLGKGGTATNVVRAWRNKWQKTYEWAQKMNEKYPNPGYANAMKMYEKLLAVSEPYEKTGLISKYGNPWLKVPKGQRLSDVLGRMAGEDNEITFSYFIHGVLKDIEKFYPAALEDMKKMYAGVPGAAKHWDEIIMRALGYRVTKGMEQLKTPALPPSQAVPLPPEPPIPLGPASALATIGLSVITLRSQAEMYIPQIIDKVCRNDLDNTSRDLAEKARHGEPVDYEAAAQRIYEAHKKEIASELSARLNQDIQQGLLDNGESDGSPDSIKHVYEAEIVRRATNLYSQVYSVLGITRKLSLFAQLQDCRYEVQDKEAQTYIDGLITLAKNYLDDLANVIGGRNE